MKRSRGILFGVFLLLIAIVHYLTGRLGENRAGHLIPIAERHPVPALTLTDLDGHPWSAAQHSGQVILVNYWATWCGPCIEEAPGLAQLSNDPALNDLAILGISLDTGGDTPGNRAKVQAFEGRFHISYPIAFAPPALPLGANMGIPTTILVDRHGRVAKLYEGAVRRAVFASDIHQLQTEP
jgi:thiol-disulfide isomerase/thioredoxin